MSITDVLYIKTEMTGEALLQSFVRCLGIKPNLDPLGVQLYDGTTQYSVVYPYLFWISVLQFMDDDVPELVKSTGFIPSYELHIDYITDIPQSDQILNLNERVSQLVLPAVNQLMKEIGDDLVFERNYAAIVLRRVNDVLQLRKNTKDLGYWTDARLEAIDLEYEMIDI